MRLNIDPHKLGELDKDGCISWSETGPMDNLRSSHGCQRSMSFLCTQNIKDDCCDHDLRSFLANSTYLMKSMEENATEGGGCLQESRGTSRKPEWTRRHVGKGEDKGRVSSFQISPGG